MNSLIKKYLMALTGLVLVGFVFVHMTGNLQVFLGQDTLNAYAHFLQTLPLPILWGARLFLLASVVIHIVVAVSLIRENKKARPIKNEIEVSKKLFQKYNWPTIDVTRKSVEETAASILKIHDIFNHNE